MKKLIKRWLSVVLVAVLVMPIIPSTKAFAQNNIAGGTTAEFKVQNPDGNYTYKVQVGEDKEVYQFDMENLDTGEITTLLYNHGVAITSNTTSDGNTVQINEVDYTESIKFAENAINTPTPMGYRGVVECLVPTLAGNRLRYAMGTTAPDIGYMLMGCDWDYRVKADACSDCSNFRNKILDCNSFFIASGVGATFSIAWSIAIILAGPTGGLSVAIAFGLNITAATALVNACFAEVSAHDSYDIAKGYGVRVY